MQVTVLWVGEPATGWHRGTGRGLPHAHCASSEQGLWGTQGILSRAPGGRWPLDPRSQKLQGLKQSMETVPQRNGFITM